MCNLYTEQTNILELTHKVLKDDLFSSKTNIDLDTFDAYPNWYIQGKYFYYFKSRGNIEVLNHFLCEKIAQRFGLSSAHFVPASTSEFLGIASQNFRESGKSYCYPSSWDFWLMGDLFSQIQLGFFGDQPKEMINDLLRVIAFQIYTEWDDLHVENLMFQKESNGYRVAPLFDFDYAFQAKDDVSTYVYRSFISQFLIPSKELESLFIQYPFFQNCLATILEIDIEQILKDIAGFWSLDINDLYLDHYKKQDELKKKLIQTLSL